jgi:hypothetical protein
MLISHHLNITEELSDSSTIETSIQFVETTSEIGSEIAKTTHDFTTCYLLSSAVLESSNMIARAVKFSVS